MIRNIIFDLGKVLIDYDFTILFRNFGINLVTLDKDAFVKQHDRLGAGEISKQEFAKIMGKMFRLDLSFAEFEKKWCSLFFPIPEMEKFALEVDQKYPTYIFSNTDEMHFPFVYKHYRFLETFKNNLMLSYEIKALKPDLIAYERALKLFNLIPQECLFIDDKEENICAAREYGMKGIVHKDLVSTRSKMLAFGLEI